MLIEKSADDVMEQPRSVMDVIAHAETFAGRSRAEFSPRS